MAYNAKYNEKNYEYRKAKMKRVGLDFPNDYYNDILLPEVERSGLTVSGFIKNAITEKIEKSCVNSDKKMCTHDKIMVPINKAYFDRMQALFFNFNESDFAEFCNENVEAGTVSEEERVIDDRIQVDKDTPDEPMRPAPVKSADLVENFKPSTGQQLDREKLEALQAEIERRKAKAEAEQEAKTAEQEAKEKDQRERAEAYNKEMQEHVKTYGVTGKWLSEGGY